MKVILVCFLFLLPVVHANIIVSEIFADPIEDESLNEWIELYNNGTEAIDLYGWSFVDEKDTDTIEGGKYLGQGAVIPAQGYAILTDDTSRIYHNFNVSPAAISLYTDDGALGNGLSNSGETLLLFRGSTLIQNITYPKAKKGQSLIFDNGSWVAALPTPGYDNTNSSFDGCEYQVRLLISQSTFSADEEFEWRMRAINNRGQPTNISGYARIEDFFGNVIREYRPWTNESITSRKTSSRYSPNLEKGKSYILFSNITTACDDFVPSNNAASFVFTLQDHHINQSSLALGNIYDLGSDEVAEFGQTIRVKVDAYKGATTKQSVAAWVEDEKGRKVSKQSKVSLEDQFTPYSLTLPLQLKPNCDEKFEDDDYIIVVKGFDTQDQKEIDIEGVSPYCRTRERKEEVSFDIVSLPEYFDEVNGEATLQLSNNQDHSEQIELWSYIYRGSKSYSGSREGNKQIISVRPNSVTEVVLQNTPNISKEGEYWVKFLMKVPDKPVEELKRKIPVALRSTIKSKEEIVSVKSQTGSVVHIPQTEKEPNYQPQYITLPETLYRSSSEKARDLVPYFLGGLLALFSFLHLLMGKKAF